MTTISLKIDEADVARIAKATAELLKGQNMAEPSAHTHQKLLTPKEASDLLRCSIVTLWRWERAGKVESCTIGGKRLYRRGDLLAALNSKK